MKPKHNWELEITNIKNMAIQGMTLGEIGKCYNVTATYIKKLIVKYNIFVNGEKYGASKRAFTKKLNKELDFVLKYGNKDNSDLYKAKRRKFIIKQSNMKRAGIEFNINFGELIFPEYCPILGIKLDYFAEGKANDNSPSFDRVDSTKEYISGNVVIISNKANRLKSDGNIEEIRKILEYLENNLH